MNLQHALKEFDHFKAGGTVNGIYPRRLAATETRRWYQRMIWPFLDLVGCSMPVHLLSPAMFAMWKSYLEVGGASHATIRAHLRAARHFCNCLISCAVSRRIRYSQSATHRSRSKFPRVTRSRS